jgi:flagellar hook-length control protein FliK
VRHAEGGLSELLQRGGIQLGDVSVGAQGGQSAGGNTPQTQARSQPPAAQGTRDTGADTDAAPIGPLRPRRDGNRPLDLFV